MPKYTKNLNLFKWDLEDQKDLSENFNIEQALNDNWSKIDEAIGDIEELLKEV